MARRGVEQGHLGRRRAVAPPPTSRRTRPSASCGRSSPTCPGAIYRVTFEDGLSLRLIGDEIERITGLPARGLRRRRHADAVLDRPPGRSAGGSSATCARCANTPPTYLAAAARRSLTIEYRIVRADGDVRWVLERGTTVLDDQDGRVCLDGVIFDVTERREAEERLRLRRRPRRRRPASVRASRARIVEAADDARRRLERDLHDGAQQRFVSAALMAQLARRRAADAAARRAVELLDRSPASSSPGSPTCASSPTASTRRSSADLGLPTALESLGGRARRCRLRSRARLHASGRSRPSRPRCTSPPRRRCTNVMKYADASTRSRSRVSERGPRRDHHRDARRRARRRVARGAARGCAASSTASAPSAGGSRSTVRRAAARPLRAVVPRDPRAGSGRRGLRLGPPGVAASSALRA